MPSGLARETTLVVLVALSFGVGFGLVARATAPLVPGGPGVASRATVVPARPPAGPTRSDGSPVPGRDGRPGAEGFGAADPNDLPPDSLARIVADLRDRRLALPVEGMERDALHDSFHDPRGEGRRHGAIDIMAPRGTPVFAVEDGTIAVLDDSQGDGGIVVYQYDPGRTYVYYYAHLEKWADGLTEGARVGRGQVIGYVGSTGNAPAGAPHLHFAIVVMGPEGRWWEGTPINPYALWSGR